jgi:hypothetical protein
MFRQLLQSLVKPANEVPLLCDTSPKSIWYADQPGGDPRRITIHDFQEIYTSKGNELFHYTETIWYDPEIKQHAALVDSEKCYEEMRGQFVELLLRPNIGTDRIYIAYISPETGFGVFARQKIDWLTLVGAYSGVFGDSLRSPDAVYAMTDLNLKGWNISAKRRGGWTRFIQQMPRSASNYYYYYRRIKEAGITNTFYYPGTLDKLAERELVSPQEFYKIFQENAAGSLHLNDLGKPFTEIATTNLFRNFYIMDGLPLFMFYANRDIQPHEPLGIDYQKGYWASQGEAPYFFDKHGERLSKYVYCPKCSAVTPKLLRCSRCKSVHYCSVACQRTDWEQHKLSCGKK